jgi:DNA-binding MarR family transcriptional regulator
MDQQELRTLRILEEIDKNKTPSQRDLSRKLNISLGLVNSFVKRLTQKGYCKVTTIPKNRVRYLLTARGAAEKSRLTYDYLKYSFVFYRKSMSRIQAVLKEFVEQEAYKIVFYGAGELAEISYTLLQTTPLKLVAVIDSDRSGEQFMDKTIMPAGPMDKIRFNKILITEINKGETIQQIADTLNICADDCALIK